MRRRVAIIIGAMKSGTSSLYQYLSQHPEVCACRKKEPEFFSSNQGHGSNVSHYEELWDFDPTAHRVCLEASTGYTKYPLEKGVPGRIKQYGLSPKFFYIVRDPVDRIRSQYNFMRLSPGMSPSGFTDPRLVELSKYYQQLAEFIRVFPDRRQYLILDFDELKSSPEDVMSRCVSFLGLRSEYDFVRMGAQNRTPRQMSDLWIERMGELKNAVGRLMTDGQRQLVKRAFRWFTPSVEHIEMNSEERATIRELLRPDMMRFKKEFRFDVDKWGF